MVRIRVLGELGAQLGEGHGGPARVDLGGPRQRGVLALLLAARGDVVSVDRLIDGLWRGEPPPKATSALQAYVSNLRRALEPDRAPRTPATTLVSAAPGYAVRLPVEAVDAWQFEALTRRAAGEPPRTALATLTEALNLWRGTAFAEFADEEWAVAEVTRLEELRLHARERRVDAGLQLVDSPAAAAALVPDAEALTGEHPLREEGWRLLALTRHAAGRRADALAALRDARTALVEEAGLEPGSALRELEADLLADRVPAPAHPTTPTSPAAPQARLDDAPPAGGTPAFVGREAEVEALLAAARSAQPSRPAVALVAGDPGAGKSALLNHFRAQLQQAGWRVTVGRCPEADGAPPAWAWVEALRQVAATDDPGPTRPELEPLLHDARRPEHTDETFARFRMHHAVGEWLREVAHRRPLAVVLDDLHRADDETLALLRSVAEPREGETPTGGPLLLIASYRPAEVAGEAVEETLASLAQRSPTRVRLDGLGPDDVGRLVEQVAGVRPDERTVTALAERTGGNPFYLTESAKLLASEGDLVAVSEVPEGVRDVLRRRLARLPEGAVAVLRLAAGFGRDVDVDVLLAAATTGTSPDDPTAGEDAVLEDLEAGVLAGLLTEPAPGQVRFAHVLVRETLYGDLPSLRRTRLHARIARALEAVAPDDVSALAHHHLLAGSPATAERAAAYAVQAAELATSRFAHAGAASLYARALAALDRVPGGVDDERRVTLLCAQARAEILAGNTVQALTSRREAIAVAERSGRDDLLVEALIGWDQATPWITRSYVERNDHAIDLLRRLLAAPRSDRDRCRLLNVLVREMGAEDDAEALQAEGLALARKLGDPRLEGLLLASWFQIMITEGMRPVTRANAERLLELGESAQIPMFAFIGHHELAQHALEVADVAAARARLAQGAELATRYGLVPAQETHGLTVAALDHITGRLDEAEAGFLATAQLMHRHGAVDAHGITALTIIGLRMTQGRLGELEPMLAQLHQAYGSIASDVWALSLAQLGRLDEARAARATAQPLAPDFLWLYLSLIRAQAVVVTGELDVARELYAQLLPFAEQLGGGRTGVFVIGPVATTLGDLAVLLGDPTAAAEHYRAGADLARRCGNPHWEASAAAGLAAL